MDFDNIENGKLLTDQNDDADTLPTIGATVRKRKRQPVHDKPRKEKRIEAYAGVASEFSDLVKSSASIRDITGRHMIEVFIDTLFDSPVIEYTHSNSVFVDKLRSMINTKKDSRKADAVHLAIGTVFKEGLRKKDIVCEGGAEGEPSTDIGTTTKFLTHVVCRVSLASAVTQALMHKMADGKAWRISVSDTSQVPYIVLLGLARAGISRVDIFPSISMSQAEPYAADSVISSARYMHYSQSLDSDDIEERPEIPQEDDWESSDMSTSYTTESDVFSATSGDEEWYDRNNGIVLIPGEERVAVVDHNTASQYTRDGTCVQHCIHPYSLSATCFALSNHVLSGGEKGGLTAGRCSAEAHMVYLEARQILESGSLSQERIEDIILGVLGSCDTEGGAPEDFENVGGSADRPTSSEGAGEYLPAIEPPVRDDITRAAEACAVIAMMLMFFKSYPAYMSSDLYSRISCDTTGTFSEASETMGLFCDIWKVIRSYSYGYKSVVNRQAMSLSKKMSIESARTSKCGEISGSGKVACDTCGRRWAIFNGTELSDGYCVITLPGSVDILDVFNTLVILEKKMSLSDVSKASRVFRCCSETRLYFPKEDMWALRECVIPHLMVYPDSRPPFTLQIFPILIKNYFSGIPFAVIYSMKTLLRMYHVSRPGKNGTTRVPMNRQVEMARRYMYLAPICERIGSATAIFQMIQHVYTIEKADGGDIKWGATAKFVGRSSNPQKMDMCRALKAFIEVDTTHYITSEAFSLLRRELTSACDYRDMLAKAAGNHDAVRGKRGEGMYRFISDNVQFVTLMSRLGHIYDNMKTSPSDSRIKMPRNLIIDIYPGNPEDLLYRMCAYEWCDNELCNTVFLSISSRGPLVFSKSINKEHKKLSTLRQLISIGGRRDSYLESLHDSEYPPGDKYTQHSNGIGVCVFFVQTHSAAPPNIITHSHIPHTPPFFLSSPPPPLTLSFAGSVKPEDAKEGLRYLMMLTEELSFFPVKVNKGELDNKDRDEEGFMIEKCGVDIDKTYRGCVSKVAGLLNVMASNVIACSDGKTMPLCWPPEAPYPTYSKDIFPIWKCDINRTPIVKNGLYRMDDINAITHASQATQGGRKTNRMGPFIGTRDGFLESILVQPIRIINSRYMPIVKGIICKFITQENG